MRCTLVAVEIRDAAPAEQHKLLTLFRKAGLGDLDGGSTIPASAPTAGPAAHDQRLALIRAGQSLTGRVVWENPFAFCGDVRSAPIRVRSHLGLRLT